MEGQPGSQENIPANVIPSPKIIIKTDPILDFILLETIIKRENPKRLKSIPDGIKPIRFIKSSVEELVAPNSLTKLFRGL